MLTLESLVENPYQRSPIILPLKFHPKSYPSGLPQYKEKEKKGESNTDQQKSDRHIKERIKELKVSILFFNFFISGWNK